MTITQSVNVLVNLQDLNVGHYLLIISHPYTQAASVSDSQLDTFHIQMRNTVSHHRCVLSLLERYQSHSSPLPSQIEPFVSGVV